MRHFPGAGNYRECDAGNLAEPAPTLAFLLRRHTRNRELQYATLGDCREPDYRLWRTFWINRARLGSVFPPARFDNLRHSHATQLVLAGVHPKVAQERFWHSTVTTTLDLYSRGTAAMQEDGPAVSTLRFRML